MKKIFSLSITTLQNRHSFPQTYLKIGIFALIHTGGNKHWPPFYILPVQLQCLQSRFFFFKLHVAIPSEIAPVAEDGANLYYFPTGFKKRSELHVWLLHAVGQVADKDSDAILAAVMGHLGHVPLQNSCPLFLL